MNPQQESYYANLTGFWKGDLQYHNLTEEATALNNFMDTPWRNLASEFLVGANLTNATEFSERLGAWNWSRSDKVDISFGDKLLWSMENSTEATKDIAMIHVRASTFALLRCT